MCQPYDILIYQLIIQIDLEKFYNDVFGWDMKKMGNPANPQAKLWMCETEDVNGNKGITGV